MERFVLRFQGSEAPAEQVSHIKKRCKVVDESTRMLLVECGKQVVDGLLNDFPAWKASPEVHYRYPETPVCVKKALR